MGGLFKFPTEIKDLISSLKDETQWEILEIIIQTNNKISYSQLKTKLNISDDEKGKLNYHLKELQKGGWLRNWINLESLDNRQKSFYSISDFGYKVIEKSLEAMTLESYQDKTLKITLLENIPSDVATVAKYRELISKMWSQTSSDYTSLNIVNPMPMRESEIQKISTAKERKISYGA